MILLPLAARMLLIPVLFQPAIHLFHKYATKLSYCTWHLNTGQDSDVPFLYRSNRSL